MVNTRLITAGPTDAPWNAVSAFANCGRAVAHVRGSYVRQIASSVLRTGLFGQPRFPKTLNQQLRV